MITENELSSLLHIHKYPKYHDQHHEFLENAKIRMDVNSDGIIEKHEYMDHMMRATKDLSHQLLFAEIPKQDLSKLAKLHNNE